MRRATPLGARIMLAPASTTDNLSDERRAA